MESEIEFIEIIERLSDEALSHLLEIAEGYALRPEGRACDPAEADEKSG